MLNRYFFFTCQSYSMQLEKMFYIENFKLIVSADQCKCFLCVIGTILPIARDSRVRGRSMKCEWGAFVSEGKTHKNNIKSRKEKVHIFAKKTAFLQYILTQRIHRTLCLLSFTKRRITKTGGITTCCFTSNHQFIGPMLFCTCWVNVPRHTLPQTGSQAAR